MANARRLCQPILHAHAHAHAHGASDPHLNPILHTAWTQLQPQRLAGSKSSVHKSTQCTATARLAREHQGYLKTAAPTRLLTQRLHLFGCSIQTRVADRLSLEACYMPNKAVQRSYRPTAWCASMSTAAARGFRSCLALLVAVKALCQRRHTGCCCRMPAKTGY